MLEVAVRLVNGGGLLDTKKTNLIHGRISLLVQKLLLKRNMPHQRRFAQWVLVLEVLQLVGQSPKSQRPSGLQL